MKKLFCLISFFISPLMFSQSLEQFSKESVSSSSISTNSISNMFYLNGKTWFGSSSGLNYFENNQFSKIETGSSILNSKSVYAISGKSNKVFIAIGETRKKDGGNIPTAMGFGISSDNGNSWTYLDFPLEDKNKTSVVFGKDTLVYLPILVPEQSVSYDCAVDGDTLWTASYASGILVSSNNGINWRRYILPPDNKNYISPDSSYKFEYNPTRDTNLNLRGFAVYKTPSGKLWAGTAGGINLRYQPEGWKKFTASSSNEKTIPGNWVTGISSQIFKSNERVWAVCWRALQSYETDGLAFTEDNGKTWTRTLLDERIYDLAFSGDTVLAVGKNGVFYSSDGLSWSFKNRFQDFDSQKSILSTEFYSSSFDDIQKRWMIGSGQGLLISAQSNIFSENNWQIYQRNTRENEGENTFTYPNPFSPDDDGICRISIPSSSNVKVSIYSLDMLPVKYLTPNYSGNVTEIIWDGRDGFGNRLSNGVYLYSVKTSTSEYWGKIFILE